MRASPPLAAIAILLALPLAAADPEPYVTALEETDSCHATECDDGFVWAGAGVRDGDSTLLDARYEVGDRLLDGERGDEGSGENGTWSSSEWSWGHEGGSWAGATVADRSVAYEVRCTSVRTGTDASADDPRGDGNATWRSERAEKDVCRYAIEADGASVAYEDGCSSEWEGSRETVGSGSLGGTRTHDECGSRVAVGDDAPLLVGRECAGSSGSRARDGVLHASSTRTCEEGVILDDGAGTRAFVGTRTTSSEECTELACEDPETTTRRGAFVEAAGHEADASAGP